MNFYIHFFDSSYTFNDLVPDLAFFMYCTAFILKY